MVSKTKFWVFLKQTQPRIIVNQNVTRVNIVYVGRKKPRTPKETRLEDKIVKTIKDWVIRDVKKLFEQEEYYKPVRVGNFYSSNYIKYKSNNDRNKTP